MPTGFEDGDPWLTEGAAYPEHDGPLLSHLKTRRRSPRLYSTWLKMNARPSERHCDHSTQLCRVFSSCRCRSLHLSLASHPSSAPSRKPNQRCCHYLSNQHLLSSHPHSPMALLDNVSMPEKKKRAANKSSPCTDKPTLQPQARAPAPTTSSAPVPTVALAMSRVVPMEINTLWCGPLFATEKKHCCKEGLYLYYGQGQHANLELPEHVCLRFSRTSSVDLQSCLSLSGSSP